MAKTVATEQGQSIRFVCECFRISESGYRYRAKNNVENQRIADWLLRLTQTHKRWDFGLCFLHLRNVKEFTWNHKRVYRIYRELELNLRIKPRRRIERDRPNPLGETTANNRVWSMDFMSDTFKYRCWWYTASNSKTSGVTSIYNPSQKWEDYTWPICRENT